MSFGWAFLFYLVIGFIFRLIFVVIINFMSYKNKNFKNDCKQVLDNLEKLVDNRSQQYENPQKFRFWLVILGYIFWPIDLAGFVRLLFPPKE